MKLFFINKKYKIELIKRTKIQYKINFNKIYIYFIFILYILIMEKLHNLNCNLNY